MFYRFLDGYEKKEHIRKQLLDIEIDIFESIRGDIEKELGVKWSGSKTQNRLADEKVATVIKSSFFSYDKQGKHPHGKFFIF